jgi:hypothetical protein
MISFSYVMALRDIVFPCSNTLTYAHPNSRTPPTCRRSEGSLNVVKSEAGYFMESL